MPTQNETIIHQLFDDLDTDNLLQIKVQSDPALEKFNNQRKRLNDSANAFNNFKNIMKNPTKLNEYQKNQAAFGFSETDIDIIFWNFLIQRGLDFMEAEKAFFVANLDNSKRLGGKNIGDKMTLGTFVVGLDNQYSIPQLRTLLDFEFRNAIAHGSYLFDSNSNFTYKDNSGVEHNLGIQDFLNKMGVFEEIAGIIFNEWVLRKP